MRPLTTVLLLAAFAAPAAAQRGQNAWRSEVGLRGGFSWFQVAGRANAGRYDMVDLPGGDLLSQGTTYGTLFAVLPWKERVAVEASLSLYQATPPITSATTGVLGLRGDYALTPHLYAAAGGVLSYVEFGGTSERQLGLQAALGYRRHLSGRLDARLEAQVVTMKRASDFIPYDVWSLLFGITTGARATGTRGTTSAPWTLAIGVNGGYQRLHVNGGATFSAFAFPAAGTSGISGLTTFGPYPASLFVTIPFGARTAIETGWDLHRVKLYNGNQTATVGQVAPRLDYALGAHWFVAAGAGFRMVKATNGIRLMAQSGVQAAAGYRFPLVGDAGGRVEVSYAVYKKRSGISSYFSDVNLFSMLVGAELALK